MNREQKELLVSVLKKDFIDSDASFLVELKGLSVAKIQELRKGLKNNNGTLKVAKTRLIKIAVKDVPCAQDLTPFLKNQLGVVFSKNDPVSTAKTLYNFSKENDKFAVVAGCFESKIIEKSSLEQIATLPSREILLAQLCGTLMATLSQLARTLDAVKQSKEKNQG